ncbi:MAG: HlyD family type I secretion periplasmic adaptor subunit [Campylobacterota bacterium]|nr:HlyD family type I secretion periplasmic adaptor subunit [Campylobacterota bacterium]
MKNKEIEIATIDSNDHDNEHHETLEKTHHSSRRLGTITILLLFGLFGLWSIYANIATTVTAQGKVITTSYNKIVTHPKGGIIIKFYVVEGDRVEKDQKLLELDGTDYKTQLDSSISNYDTNLLNICRLDALAELSDSLDCSSFESRLFDKDSFEQLNRETNTLFRSDISNIRSKISLLNKKNEIYASQNRGLQQQIKSNKKLLKSYQNELKKWEKLLKEEAIDELKAIETERRIEQVKQQINSLESNIDENLATVEANKQQIILEAESFKNKALTERNKLKLNNEQIKGKIIALENGLKNSTIKAPSDGLVTDMKLHADGEVVSPHKPIMTIVPDSKELMLEAFVLLTDIEKVYVGEKVDISFASFVDPSAVPIEGEITYLSADAIIPEGSKESFYKILVKITPDGLKALEENKFTILPGMPVSLFIQTGETTLMRYLMQPIIQLSKGIFNAN